MEDWIKSYLYRGSNFQCQSRSLVECRSGVSPLMSIKQNVDFDVKFTFQVDGNGGKSPRISRHFNAPVAQLVRARPCHGRGCGFEFHLMLQVSSQMGDDDVRCRKTSSANRWL